MRLHPAITAAVVTAAVVAACTGEPTPLVAGPTATPSATAAPGHTAPPLDEPVSPSPRPQPPVSPSPQPTVAEEQPDPEPPPEQPADARNAALGTVVTFREGDVVRYDGAGVTAELLAAGSTDPMCQDCPVRAELALVVDGRRTVVTLRFSGNATPETQARMTTAEVDGYRVSARRIDDGEADLVIERAGA